MKFWQKTIINFALTLIVTVLISGCSNDDTASSTKTTKTPPHKEVQQVQSDRLKAGISEALAIQRAALLKNIVYNLTFHIPDQPTVDIVAEQKISFDLLDPSQSLILDFREDAQLLKRLSVNGQSQTINHKNEHLVIAPINLKKDRNIIEIDFVAGNTSLNRNPDYLHTLFVPDRARTVFPVFDQPDLKARYELTLDVPKQWNALANAPLLSLEEQDTRKLYKFSQSDLISSYLFSFVAGDFQTETRTLNGREMNFLHREKDKGKVARNIDQIFELHAAALAWLEEYTDIEYPFQKFDFALIPTFQYGGMEHVGAIQYRASSLFLDEDPSQTQLLNRANLIAHETAHMWFGDLVTMKWFNDVWTKEVFANFMAAKIVNPSFPDINHDLNFLLRAYPAAYSVDRTKGANAIRQHLPNLNEAGTLYGAIIYNKAPIMMRQLERILGEDIFREGMREYLKTFANKNATWPDLISILDQKSPQDLKQWSEVWVNTPGRPVFSFEQNATTNQLLLTQSDPSGLNRFWPQQFSIVGHQGDDKLNIETAKGYTIENPQLPLESGFNNPDQILVNADGFGYGLFPASLAMIENQWDNLGDLQKGVLFIQVYEQMLENTPRTRPVDYIKTLIWTANQENNELLLNTVLNQIRTIYWRFLSPTQRDQVTPLLENMLIKRMTQQDLAPSSRKIFFNNFQAIASTPTAIEKLNTIWSGRETLDGISLSQRELTNLAANVAIKIGVTDPEKAQSILATQLAKINNPDDKRRFEYLMPSLSSEKSIRDDFFNSLKEAKNRETESWTLTALSYLHHPLRLKDAEKYILPSLALMEEIQATGDIFFPERWSVTTLQNHNSPQAAQTVRDFLSARKDYNYQLKLKILQAADPVFRAETILKKAK